MRKDVLQRATSYKSCIHYNQLAPYVFLPHVLRPRRHARHGGDQQVLQRVDRLDVIVALIPYNVARFCSAQCSAEQCSAVQCSAAESSGVRNRTRQDKNKKNGTWTGTWMGTWTWMETGMKIGTGTGTGTGTTHVPISAISASSDHTDCRATRSGAYASAGKEATVSGGFVRFSSWKPGVPVVVSFVSVMVLCVMCLCLCMLLFYCVGGSLGCPCPAGSRWPRGSRSH